MSPSGFVPKENLYPDGTPDAAAQEKEEATTFVALLAGAVGAETQAGGLSDTWVTVIKSIPYLPSPETRAPLILNLKSDPAGTTPAAIVAVYSVQERLN